MAVQPRMFPDSASFSLNELLKTIQKNGISTLWAEVDTLDAVIKKTSLPFGKDVTMAFNVDAGGGAFSRLAQQGGVFAPGDRTRNILGKVKPKSQTFTLQFERFADALSKEQAKAYINTAKQEYDSKMAFQKSFMALQFLGDGTARQAEPIAFGATDTVSGANFTIASERTPLKIKISSLDTAAGSVAHLMEGSVISFPFVDVDPGTTGTASVTQAAGLVRLLALTFTQGDSKTYDAFRVVKVEQETNYIYVLPARLMNAVYTGSTPDATGSYVQQSNWTDGAGVVTVTFTKGVRADLVVSATDADYNDTIASLALVFSATASTDSLPTKIALIHPLFINQSQAAAREQIGVGWTGSTDVAFIHDGIFTGLETLLCNESNTVHGIDRGNVLQYLATSKDNGLKDLTFNSLYSFLSQHVNRNRKMQFDWSSLMMNPITYSSMISLSELDRRITEGKGIRGEDGAKIIQMHGKKFQFDEHSSQRHDRIYCLAKNAVEMHGGKENLIKVGGQGEYLAMVDGRRTNVIESYYEVIGELTLECPRVNAYMRNYKITTF